MKVLLNTPDRLVLRDLQIGTGLALGAVTALPALMAWGYFRNGIWSGGIVLSAIALILLLGCFGALVRPITITLDRPGNTVTVVERSLFGTRRKVHALDGLSGASLEARVIRHRPQPGESDRRRRRPDRRVWRAVLVPARGGPTLPLGEVFGSQAAAGTAASAINGWIGQRPRPAA